MNQIPKTADSTFTRFITWRAAHVWIARFFSIFLTHEWFVFATRSDAFNRYRAQVILTMMPKVFVLYVLGLWLSSTQWGFRHKKVTYVLLLPSLLMSPSVAGFPGTFMGWLALFVAIWSYVIIYKVNME